MDTRSKSSHKIGIITAVLFLAFCSVIMMGQYGSMASYLNTEEAEDTWKDYGVVKKNAVPELPVDAEFAKGAVYLLKGA